MFFPLKSAAVSSHHQSVAPCGRPPHTVVHRGHVPVMNKDSVLYIFLMWGWKYSAAPCPIKLWNKQGILPFLKKCKNVILKNDPGLPPPVFPRCCFFFNSALTPLCDYFFLFLFFLLYFFSQLRSLTMKTSPLHWASRRAPSLCCCALRWQEEPLSGTTNAVLTPTPQFFYCSSRLW